MDGDLRLDLEALGEHRHGLHEHAVERAVARHDVVEGEAVDLLDQPAHQVVAEAVERAVVLLAVGAVGQAGAHRHVGAVGAQRLQERRRCLGGVGVVAVDHQVVVGVDVAEHGADDVALALAPLELHDGAVLAGDVGRAVLGVVVVDVDVGVRQDALEVVHHLADGHGFVVAGYEYCDLVCH